ncbi:UDP-N-acetylgalactosamine-undecaprenyl-phosphate N-acetylgalactosaminephosphotransferase [Halomonas sp. THAF5a]|uniref:exopolysaccharide biosynthesis polyprenyl glycosylphosphotransferase n=1 Tax=Halomonas sp. THAF5a TaxID=2587844 RepID=UPI001267FA9D|nr:exopolysaccharide biosynthesis polyprenyl glycosylphosphotransferase [Halomonas sp. THAF5a]QFU01505.1 UDP-N-acetylgalactosamine-undecaprenyl-phosphate N-acetylgalactosaminephosphotransferase [Halomonas sp. THAF5a]
MNNHTRYERRHSRWYEGLLLGWPFQLIVGALVVMGLPAWERWGWGFWEYLPQVRTNTLLACGLAFIGILWTLRRMHRFPGARLSAFIAPYISVAYLLVVAVLFFTREEYTRQVLFGSYLMSLGWFYLAFFLGRRYRRMKLAVVPVGRIDKLLTEAGVDFRRLEMPDLGGVRYDGIVADLRSDELSPAWEKFLARCTLNHIPVYHIRQIQESLSGRVEVEHLTENEYGSLLPSFFYQGFKRCIDLVSALLLLPLLTPVMLAVAVAIRLDSSGPALFIQHRMGFRGVPFRVYKFRSMYIDQKGSGFTEGDDDPRITKVGRFIRKCRLDELPQLFNVIKGEMSFIGPRPESMQLSEWYERDVPFFSYRHVVRPGISGWAQVEQGYAAEVDGMTTKLQYDFYYIKHFSLWLDVLIAFKTLKTIVTGDGAR